MRARPGPSQARRAAPHRTSAAFTAVFSATTSSPLIRLWPEPQYSEHSIGKVPGPVGHEADPDRLAALRDRDLHGVGLDREAVVGVRGAQHELDEVALPHLDPVRLEPVARRGHLEPLRRPGGGRGRTGGQQPQDDRTTGPRESDFFTQRPPSAWRGGKSRARRTGRCRSARCGPRRAEGLTRSVIDYGGRKRPSPAARESADQAGLPHAAQRAHEPEPLAGPQVGETDHGLARAALGDRARPLDAGEDPAVEGRGQPLAAHLHDHVGDARLGELAAVVPQQDVVAVRPRGRRPRRRPRGGWSCGGARRCRGPPGARRVPPGAARVDGGGRALDCTSTLAVVVEQQPRPATAAASAATSRSASSTRRIVEGTPEVPRGAGEAREVALEPAVALPRGGRPSSRAARRAARRGCGPSAGTPRTRARPTESATTPLPTPKLARPPLPVGHHGADGDVEATPSRRAPPSPPRRCRRRGERLRSRR